MEGQTCGIKGGDLERLKPQTLSIMNFETLCVLKVLRNQMITEGNRDKYLCQLLLQTLDTN